MCRRTSYDLNKIWRPLVNGHNRFFNMNVKEKGLGTEITPKVFKDIFKSC